MVEISNFKQAFQFYQSNQLPLTIIQDLGFIFMNAYSPENPPIINNPSELSIEQLEWLSKQEATDISFDDYIGGNAYLCESESDLNAIKGYDQKWFDQYGDWPNVTDKAMQWDVCMQLDEAWAVFAYCWNNAGGNLYYVPSHLSAKAKVSDHLLFNRS